jgi:hypothetical protein
MLILGWPQGVDQACRRREPDPIPLPAGRES